MIGDAGGVCPTKNRGIHIAYLNLQSMNNKFNLIKIQVREMGFQIFTFSESWLTDSIPDTQIGIDGYNVDRSDRSWNEENGNGIKKGSGVGFYIRDDLTFSQSGLLQYNISSRDIECCWLKLINKEAKNILLCTLYRSPTGNVENFCYILTTTIEEIGNSTNKEIIESACPIRVGLDDLIFITKKKGAVKRKQVSFIGRSYRNYDKASFQNYLMELD